MVSGHPDSGSRERTPRTIALLLFLAILLWAIAAPTSDWRWLAARCGLALAALGFGAGFAGLRTTVDEGDAEPARSRAAVPGIEIAAYALLLGAALFVRVDQVGLLPEGIWYDEAQNVLEAERILHEPGYWPVFVAGASQMPALFFYLCAPFVAAFGPVVLAVRLLTAIAGTLAVAATGWLARRWFGAAAGLLAAGFLAFSRWHVTFSRFGMAMVFATLAMPLTLALFDRALARRRPGASVAAGTALGLGLQTYYSVLAAPALLLTYGAAHALRERAGARRALSVLAIVLAIAALLYAPVATWASQHPELFAQRMRTALFAPVNGLGGLVQLLSTASEERDRALQTLRSNTRAHLRMFHFEGDSNGRHNLPGAPMLEPALGFLAAVGLLVLLLRPLDPRTLTLVAWVAASLLAGILSLGFEAPQAARTLGITPALAIAAALPLAAALGALSRMLGASRSFPRGAAVAVALLGALVLLLQFHAFRSAFRRQQLDPAVWASHSAPESAIGRMAAADANEVDHWLPAEWIDTPSQRLLLGHPLSASALDTAAVLPLPAVARAARVIVPADQGALLAALRALYPGAVTRAVGPPRDALGHSAPPVFTALEVTGSERVALGAGTLVSGSRAGDPADSWTSADWSWAEWRGALPDELVATATVRVPASGLWELELVSDPEARLRLDGEPLLEASAPRRQIPLAAGLHDLEFAIRLPRAAGRTTLRWRGPGEDTTRIVGQPELYSPRVETGGLLADCGTGLDWNGSPSSTRIDAQVGRYFHELPLSRPFWCRWTGDLVLATATCAPLRLRSINEAELELDGRTVLTSDGSGAPFDAAPCLDAGAHALALRYRNTGDYAQVYFEWAPAGGPFEIVDPGHLRPARFRPSPNP